VLTYSQALYAAGAACLLAAVLVPLIRRPENRWRRTLQNDLSVRTVRHALRLSR
jgi:hypothetical protein